MDTQIPNPGFAVGDSVIYGTLGKCTVKAIETRDLGSQQVSFYKLEVQKSPLSRSTRQEPAIFLPIQAADKQGLRPPMNRAQAEATFAILESKEFYFRIDESWSSVQPRLEATIRAEGGVGMAKVISYLHVRQRRELAPSSDLNRYHEAIQKLFIRELVDALELAPKALETKVTRAMRHKLLPDH